MFSVLDPVIGAWVGTASILLILILIQFVLNLRVVRRIETVTELEQFPLVSVLIPARNEAGRISECLKSLISQDYPTMEIIVLDDQSSDGTADVVAGFGFAATGQHRIVTGRQLPPGWTGKSWACHQLSQIAQGEYLLFTDADTIHHSKAISAAVAEAGKTAADLLTLWPRQVTRSVAEQLMVPLIFVAANGFLPHWLLVLAQKHRFIARRLGPGLLRGLGAANGQFIFFRKFAYDRLGGHQAVQNHLVEDVALARLVTSRTQEGFRLISRDGTRLVGCRMYRSFTEMWEGFTKNIWPLFDHDLGAFVIAMIGQFLVFVLPFILIFFLYFRLDLWCLCGLIFLLRAVAAVRFRSSWLTVLLHPIGYGLALLIAGNSLRCGLTKGVAWKGRIYRPRRSS